MPPMTVSKVSALRRMVEFFSVTSYDMRLKARASLPISPPAFLGYDDRLAAPKRSTAAVMPASGRVNERPRTMASATAHSTAARPPKMLASRTAPNDPISPHRARC